MELKKITAIVRSDQLEDVENRLKGPTIPGISVDHVKGYGEYANFFTRDWMSRYARLEIVTDARHAQAIVDAIMDVAHTGTKGDGMICVLPVDQVYRIRDGHHERSASPCPRCRAAARVRQRRHRASVSSKKARVRA